MSTNLKRYTIKRQDFSRRLCLLKVEAGQLGLWRTMHAMEPAVREVGWEIADIQAGKQIDTVKP